MALKPIVPKSAYLTQPTTQSDSFAQQDETSFSSASPSDSGVFNQRAELDSQLGITPPFSFPDLSSALSQDSFCSEISTLEGGVLYGGNCETKILSYGNQRGLDNASRELLLSRKMGYAAIVLDILLKVWGVGQRFTERQALAELQPYGIGRRSLRNALHAAPAGHGVFKLRLFKLAGIHKPKRGRHAQMYELPSAAEVANRLLLPRTPSDDLKADDLKGLTAYRAALHRELIRRQPRQYSRAWLAARLGVSKRTVRDYDKRAGITVTPLYGSDELKSIYIAHMPEDRKQDLSSRAQWLEWQGKRYPALKVVARRLMQLGGATIVRQYSNHYQINA